MSSTQPTSSAGDLSSTEFHARSTRCLHAALAITILVQLASSLFMVPPLRDYTENVFFEIHEYSGLFALLLATLFWVKVLFRKRGTPMSRLMPWFSTDGRQAVMSDMRDHWNALKARQIPPYINNAPLATAVHGLGLLLMFAMAVTGGLFYLALVLGVKEAVWADLVLQLHSLLSSLVWAYLVGHGGTALMYHYVGQLKLSRMWSFGKDADESK